MKCPHCNKYKCVNELDCMAYQAKVGSGNFHKTLCVHCKKPLVVVTEVHVSHSVSKGDHADDECDWPQFAGQGGYD